MHRNFGLTRKRIYAILSVNSLTPGKTRPQKYEKTLHFSAKNTNNNYITGITNKITPNFLHTKWKFGVILLCRGNRIRTCDPLLPKQVR